MCANLFMGCRGFWKGKGFEYYTFFSLPMRKFRQAIESEGEAFRTEMY